MIASSEAVAVGAALDTELTTWLTPGTYGREKGKQKYFSGYTFPDYEWSLNVMTYDQDPGQFEGATLGLVWCDEPPPEAIWGALAARMRKGGVIFITMTPLGEAAWIYDKLEGAEEVEPGLRVNGRWAFLQADVEDNCKTHVCGGVGGWKWFRPALSLSAVANQGNAMGAAR